MFASSWVGATVFWIGEWFIKRMPFVKHIYSASKQISTAISPGNTVIFGLKIHYYPEFNILLEFRIYTQYIIRVITNNSHRFNDLHIPNYYHDRDCKLFFLKIALRI